MLQSGDAKPLEERGGEDEILKHGGEIVAGGDPAGDGLFLLGSEGHVQ